MARVRQEVGEDGGDLVSFFGRIYRGEIKAGVRDRMEAGKWLADRGFGKSVETSITLDATAASHLDALPDGELGGFVRGYLKKKIERLAEPVAVGQAVDGQVLDANPLEPLPDPTE